MSEVDILCVRPFQKGQICRFYVQPTPKLRMQFSEQRCYVGCILIPCIDKVGPFEMVVHICEIYLID